MNATSACLLIILGTVSPSFAQKFPPPPSKQVLRVVEGKLYDAANSVLWEIVQGDCVAVLTNGIVVQQFETQRERIRTPLTESQSIGAYAPSAAFRTIYIPTRKVFIRNYPAQLRPHVDAEIRVRALRVQGEFRWEGGRLSMWDTGTAYIPPPATNSTAAVTNQP